MKTKILYILVSTEKDYFLEMTMMSAFSAKQKMPDCHISLLTDDLTDKSLTGNRKRLLDYIDEKIVVDLDNKLSGKRKSRYLKTSMRNHIDGDYIYVDSDTVITQSLKEIDDFDFEIGAIADGHLPVKEHHYHWIITRETKPLGYDIERLEYYFNGGVMYVKDTPNTRSFFNQWHNEYKKHIEQIDQDQPSLNLLQYNTQQITAMPAEYNVQMIVGMQYIATAKILHFFSATSYPLLEIASKEFLAEIKERGITERAKKKILNPLTTILPLSAIVRCEDFYFRYSENYDIVRNALFKDNTTKPIFEEKIFAKINKLLLLLETKYLNLRKRIFIY